MSNLSCCLSSIFISFFVNLAVSSSPLVSASQQGALVTAYGVFANIMACHVFRGIALGYMTDRSTVGLTSTRIAAAFQLNEIPVIHSLSHKMEVLNLDRCFEA